VNGLLKLPATSTGDCLGTGILERNAANRVPAVPPHDSPYPSIAELTIAVVDQCWLGGGPFGLPDSAFAQHRRRVFAANTSEAHCSDRRATAASAT